MYRTHTQQEHDEAETLAGRIAHALHRQHGAGLVVSPPGSSPDLRWRAAADTRGTGLLAQAEGTTPLEALERLLSALKANGYALELDTRVAPPHQPS